MTTLERRLALTVQAGYTTLQIPARFCYAAVLDKAVVCPARRDVVVRRRRVTDTMLLDSIVLFVLFVIAVVAAERDGGAFFVVFIGFGYMALRNYLEKQKLAAAMREFANRVRGLELNQMKLQGLAIPKPADVAASPPQ